MLITYENKIIDSKLTRREEERKEGGARRRPSNHVGAKPDVDTGEDHTSKGRSE